VETNEKGNTMKHICFLKKFEKEKKKRKQIEEEKKL